jgi:hypothetical protein
MTQLITSMKVGTTTATSSCRARGDYPYPAQRGAQGSPGASRRAIWSSAEPAARGRRAGKSLMN